MDLIASCSEQHLIALVVVFLQKMIELVVAFQQKMVALRRASDELLAANTAHFLFTPALGLRRRRSALCMFSRHSELSKTV